MLTIQGWTVVKHETWYDTILYLQIVTLQWEFVCFRYPDEEAGEIPMAYIVKEPKSALSPQDVMDFVAKQVSALLSLLTSTCSSLLPKPSEHFLTISHKHYLERKFYRGAIILKDDYI